MRSDGSALSLKRWLRSTGFAWAGIAHAYRTQANFRIEVACGVLACAAALAVLDTIERDGLLEQVKATGEHLVEAVEGLGHPLVREVRGAGLLRAIALTRDVSAQVTADLEARGPIVNPVRPDTIRLAPPLVLTTDEVDEFVADLSVVLDGIVASEGGTP